MPSTSGRTLYKYDSISNTFIEEEIKEKQIIDYNENIFDDKILDTFRNNPVLFVYSKNILKGVIHFCDYNRNIVYVHIYALLLEYERLLRLYLIQNKIQEDELLESLTGNTQKIKNRRMNGEDTNIEPFQIFDLGHITDFINLKFKLNFNPDREITKFRNYIMHGKNLISKENYLNENFIYNYHTFDIFFNRVKTLQLECNRIYNFLVFEKYNI